MTDHEEAEEGLRQTVEGGLDPPQTRYATGISKLSSEDEGRIGLKLSRNIIKINKSNKLKILRITKII